MEDRKGHSWLAWNSPNFISSTRLLAPFILFGTSWSIETKMFVLLILSFTDYVDGIVARWVDNTRGIGGFIEKIADKVLQASGLIFLLSEELLEDWLAIPIISGELFITLLVLYGIYLVIIEEVRKNKSKSLKKIYASIKSEIIRSLIASGFGRTKMFVYGMGVVLIYAYIIIPFKFFWYSYVIVFVVGLYFCVGVSVEYYKRFINWKNEFFNNDSGAKI